MNMARMNSAIVDVPSLITSPSSNTYNTVVVAPLAPIVDVYTCDMASENTLNLSGYMKALNIDMNDPVIIGKFTDWGNILDKHERLALDGLWLEQVELAKVADNTGITYYDMPTGGY